MPVSVNIRLPAKLVHLEQLVDFVANCAQRHGITHKRVGEIKVAAEEAIVNVINYAYGENEGDIEVVCISDDDRFIIKIVDSGSPFNLLSHKDPDIYMDMSERAIGGLGIYLIKKLVDYIEYKRENESNIVTLVITNKIRSEQLPA